MPRSSASSATCSSPATLSWLMSLGQVGWSKKPNANSVRRISRDAFVERRFADDAGRQQGVDLGRRVAGVEDVDVQARFEVVAGLVARAGVRGDVAGEAPFFAQRVFEQVLVGARVDAVDEVVRAHHGGAVGLLDGGFEGGEFDFVKPSGVDVDVGVHAPADHTLERRDPDLALLVVGGEVLDVGHHALGLEAVDPAHGGLRIEVGILAVPLIRAPAKRRAHDVDGRTVVAVEPAVPDLDTHDFAIPAGHRRVEVRGQRDAGRHRRRVFGARADPTGTDGAVGELDRRQTDVRGFLAGEDPDLVGLAHRRQHQLRTFAR